MTENEVLQRLNEIAGGVAPAVTNIAVVKSVDIEACTCTLIDEDGQEFYEVRLRPITGKNQSFLQVPAVDSFVLAVRVEDTQDWAVIGCEKIESIQVLIGSESVIDIINDFIEAIRNMSFTTNTGCTIQLINDLQFIELKKRLNHVIK